MLPGPGHYNSDLANQKGKEAVRSQQLGNFSKSQGGQM